MVCRFKLLFVCLIPLLLGCKGDDSTIDWNYREAPISGHWSKIVINPNGFGYMVGGEEWQKGYAGETTDGGESWQIDSISNKRLYDIHIDANDHAYTVGVDGYLLTKAPEGEWVFHRLAQWITNRGVAYWNSEKGVIGSGAAFGNGILTNYRNLSESDVELLLDFEISDVCFSDANTVHAVGYGVIVRSTDGGQNWEFADVSNDYFQSIQFVNENVGYVVGFTGSILKTTDSGLSWQYLRDSQSTFVRDYPMRDLFFENENKGYICGEDGLLWYTRDGGVNWTEVLELPKENFNSVATFESRGYLVGENSVFVEFNLP